jgi:hypothetical protein
MWGVKMNTASISRCVIALSFLVLCAFLICGHAYAADWPCYRGPNHDGSTSETIASWPPVEVWRATTGSSFSQVSVANGYVYTMGNVGGNDIVYCFDESSVGNDPTPVWTKSYSCGAGGGESGTRCTPTVYNGKVYTLSQEGDLRCWDAVTGTEDTDWQMSFSAGRHSSYGFGGSPYVDVATNRLILTVGDHGTAIDMSSQTVVWGNSGNRAGYATVFRRGSELIAFSGTKVMGLNPSSGNENWSFPWDTDYDCNCQVPLFYGSYVWIASAYNKDTCALVPLGSGDLTGTDVYDDGALGIYCNAAVLIGDYVYGVNCSSTNNGYLVCLDVMAGTRAWTSSGSYGATYGSVLNAGGEVVALSQSGDLVVVEANPAAYNELHRENDIISGSTKTAPVLSNGKLYIRSREGTLACFDVSGVAPDTVTVSSPNGGENWTGGTSETVTWSTTGTVGNVMIELSTNGGSTWSTLLASTPNDGSQSVSCPLTASTQCRIKVSETDGSPSDTSNSNFTITVPVDSDSDGMDDSWEITYFGDLSHDGSADGDSDGLDDLEEFQNGSAPNDNDSDDDGLTDGAEVNTHGTEPDDSDSDDDGLSDGDEINTHSTDPLDADSDDDGASDGAEIAAGTDPNDPASVPESSSSSGTKGGCAAGGAAAFAFIIPLGFALLARRKR